MIHKVPNFSPESLIIVDTFQIICLLLMGANIQNITI